MGFLSAFLTFAISQAEAHPEVLKSLYAGIASAIATHEAHPAPASVSAVAELRAGIAAAASSAVTSLIAKQGLGTAATPIPSLAAPVQPVPTVAPAPSPDAGCDAPRMA